MAGLQPPGSGQCTIELDCKATPVVLKNGEFLVLIATGRIGGRTTVSRGLKLAKGRRESPQGGVEICRQAHLTAIRRLEWMLIWRKGGLSVNELRPFVHR